MRWLGLWHDARMAGVNHYENFPVASWLCPARWRAPVTALYHFARTADDLADEGDLSAEARLDALRAYRASLDAACAEVESGAPQPSSRWPHVFGPLAKQMAEHHLPRRWMDALLDAFEQDVRYTASGHRYRDEAELLDYCTRSANPVGRLILHLHGVSDDVSLGESDDICTALQLINFWQDLGVDVHRRRHYVPLDAMERHGVPASALTQPHPHPAAQAMVLELAGRARQRMLRGAPLCRRLPGRVGWELRLVVQGGLRILDKIEALQGHTWVRRPALSMADLPLMVCRAALSHPTPQPLPA